MSACVFADVAPRNANVVLVIPVAAVGPIVMLVGPVVPPVPMLMVLVDAVFAPVPMSIV